MIVFGYFLSMKFIDYKKQIASLPAKLRFSILFRITLILCFDCLFVVDWLHVWKRDLLCWFVYFHRFFCLLSSFMID